MNKDTTKDKEKQDRILDAAAELFTKHPFHKVLLSDVARLAGVGKGTVYLYFGSKDELYFGVLFRGFSFLVVKMREYLDEESGPVDVQLRGLIRLLAEHLYRKSINMELMSRVMACPTTDEWWEKRRELWTLIENVIRQGVAQGLFEDEEPHLTAQYIPALIRSVCRFNPEGVDIEAIAEHASGFVLRGIEKKTNK